MLLTVMRIILALTMIGQLIMIVVLLHKDQVAHDNNRLDKVASSIAILPFQLFICFMPSSSMWLLNPIAIPLFFLVLLVACYVIRLNHRRSGSNGGVWSYFQESPSAIIVMGMMIVSAALHTRQLFLWQQ